MKKYFPLLFCLLVIGTLGAGAFTLAWSDPESEIKPPSSPLPPSVSSPAPLVPASPTVTDGRPKLLRISAIVDGSGRIIFTRKAVHYVHKYWGIPKDVTFDGGAWDDTSETPASWHQIAAHYDLSKARIIERDGRDTIALELTEEGFDLYLCDTPSGRDHYEVIISIPPRS